jgi:RNA polymerase sigma-70 factor (subfamily 1)
MLGSMVIMSDNSGESALIQQAIAGDRGVLSQLLLAHSDDLERHVGQLLAREAHEAMSLDDVLQQTFVRSALAIHGFQERGPGSFGAWLRTIARNLVRDAQKRRRRERRAHVDEVPADGGEGTAAKGLDQLAADTTSPSMCVHRRDSVRRMVDALALLPSEQREVIQRHYLQHQSLEQVAEAMSRTKDAVRGICYRARQNLRASLGNSSCFFSS